MQAGGTLRHDSDPERKRDVDQAEPRWHLTVLGQDTISRHVLSLAGRITLSSDPAADVRISSSAGVRPHAVLHLGEELFIENLGAGAMRVRDIPISTGQRSELRPGDTVALGTTLLVFQLGSVAASPGRLPGPVASPGQRAAQKYGARHASGMRMRAVHPEHDASSAHDLGSIVLEDPAMQKLRVLVEQLAVGLINVLILGETGVGKDVFAELLHRLSPRWERSLVRINCAALPASLLESELFGHEVGAFTGAVEAKPGLFECAEGGTVFLDEIGELPVTIQAKLLRVIEAREVVRVGGVRVRRIDVRFVAATNRNLASEIKDGRFRQDLFFRLNGARLTVPPLRERPREIEPLARRFLSEVCAKLGRTPEPIISDAAWVLLKAYSWPGNVRELRNVVECAALVCTASEITPDDLSRDGAAFADGAIPCGAAPSRGPSEQVSLSLTAEKWADRERILEVLEDCGGNQSRAAKLLGISRTTLVTRLDTYGIRRPRKRF
jgi:two-component system response regulator AtoC